jgi:hypothetical protein
MSLVELARYSSGAEAEIVRGRLEAGGIMSFCFDSGMNIAEGVGMMIPVRVMVIPEDLEDARQLLSEDGGRD